MPVQRHTQTEHRHGCGCTPCPPSARPYPARSTRAPFVERKGQRYCSLSPFSPHSRRLAPFAQRKGRARAKRVCGVCACSVTRRWSNVTAAAARPRPPSARPYPARSTRAPFVERKGQRYCSLSPFSPHSRRLAPFAQRKGRARAQRVCGVCPCNVTRRWSNVTAAAARPRPPSAHAYPARFTRAPFVERKGLASSATCLRQSLYIKVGAGRKTCPYFGLSDVPRGGETLALYGAMPLSV